MNPGRELDVLVAEKLFGLKIRDRFTGEETPITGAQILAHMSDLSALPQYSTDIKAAWDVVEKIRGTGKPFSLSESVLLKPSSNEKWRATFTSQYEGFSDSAPHAICLAALKACGVEV